jgi:hypothetical protein
MLLRKGSEMFLEHTVMVKFPILVITVNIKTTAMFWTSVKKEGGGGEEEGEVVVGGSDGKVSL